MPETLTPQDENTLALPEEWAGRTHPRRDGHAVNAAVDVRVRDSAGAALRRVVAKARPALDSLLAGRAGEPDLAEAARRHLDGKADPAGAAAVAAVVGLAGVDGATPGVFVDGWVREHGLAFAACAVVERDGLAPERAAGGDWRGAWVGVVRKVQFPREDGRLRRMRALLAVAGEDDHREVVARLAELRTTPQRREWTAYLVPGRPDWLAEVDDLTARPPGADRELLLSALAPEHLGLFGDRLLLAWGEATPAMLATLLDGLGPAALPLLLRTYDHDRVDAAALRLVLEAISVIPTDEAFRALLERRDRRFAGPALLAAARRFPERALRIYAAEAAAPDVADLLAAHLRVHPRLRDADLPADVRAVVETLEAAGGRVPDAAPEDLPESLVSPPWTRARPNAEPVVVKGLKPLGEPRVVWSEGERESWATPHLFDDRWTGPDTDWAEAVRRFAERRLKWRDSVDLLQLAPVELVRPLVGGWWGAELASGDDVPWLRTVVARFEIDAFPFAMAAVKASSGDCGEILLPYLDADVAKLMAGGLEKGKRIRPAAEAWFERHGADAARPLVPAALGKPGGKARRDAERALLFLVDRVGADAVVAAAREYGDQAADAVAGLAARDPLATLPEPMPSIGTWADPAVLPPVLLRGRERALPLAATGHLITMLAVSRPDAPYPLLAEVREACDPASLAAFGWALFREWERGGSPAGGGWALAQLALTGDDDTVRRLTPVIRAWPGENGHHKAVVGLDVLAAIGTETALTHLNGIARKVRFKALRERAQEKIGEVADVLGLTADQLADRLVPDFGLDADGSMVLDYGPRRFTVGFDEQLRPFVRDESGKPRKSLPKPGAKDDPEAAEAAYQRFAQMKKDVRAVASGEVHRLERAMVTGRRWTAEEFRTHVVEHPLIRHLARRLVWQADGTAFRVAEDGTLADVDDDAFDLPGTAPVHLPHPIHLGDDLKAWAEVFADYEILQPFPQLGRPVHALTDTERDGTRLPRFEGVTVPTGLVLGLERRGWVRGPALDAGFERWISKPVADGLHVVANLEPGVHVSHLASAPRQTIHHLWLGTAPDDHYDAGPLERPFAALDPVTASEVLADLADLTETRG
ncbi:DUF4132 domain-containing protein [Actinomadura kijaniata]|uniref:DUF4132 domain-containing protein n=1 Tax=Actinomadura kijaniata TaxID=46161 RepID=UPI001C3F17A5|nr:DUF4132 domain-containing protein [Actinomadura kijaniata]